MELWDVWISLHLTSGQRNNQDHRIETSIQCMTD
jgi:hypothetical protein